MRFPSVRSLLLLPSLLALGCAAEMDRGNTTEPTGKTGSTQQAIVGGRDASTGEYPFMVSLQFTSTYKDGTFDGMHFCGGSLVAPSYILTAGHCLDDLKVSDFRVVIGRTQLSDATQGQSRVVSSFVLHPSLNSGPNTWMNDVAIIRLSSPSTMKPIELAAPYGPSHRAAWTTGKPARVIGWGQTACSRVFPDVLQELDVTIPSDDTMVTSMAEEGLMFDPKVSVGYDGADSSQGYKGDSGGPIFVYTDSGLKQMGVVSYGKTCELYPGDPRAAARVAALPLYRWIRSIIHNTPAIGDFNGDGKADIVSFTHGEGAVVGEEPVYVALSDGTKFGTAQRWQSHWSHAGAIPLVGDFNGDGKTDIYSVTMGGDAYVALSTGASFNGAVFRSLGVAKIDDIPRVGDVNGDGRDDLVLFSTDESHDVHVLLAGPYGFGPKVKWHAWFASEGETPLVADVNGDGKADILTFTQGMNGRNDVFVSLSGGSTFGTKTLWASDIGRPGQAPSAGRLTRTAAPFNFTDPSADIVVFVRDEPSPVVVGRSTGSGASFTTQLWSFGFGGPESTFLVGDVTGDGADDIIEVTQNALRDVYVAPSTGSGFGTRARWHEWFAP